MPIYEKPVHALMKDMVAQLGIGPADIITRDQVWTWFQARYPKIKKSTVNSHLIRLSANAPSRVNWNFKPEDDDVFYQIDSSRFRLYDPLNDPAAIGKHNADDRQQLCDPADSADDVSTTEFAYEHDLRDYLAKNLHLVEPGLRLYEDEGVKGIEFPAGNRYIDILAIDKNDDYVVIELKVSRGYDRVVGQLLRYVGWIQQNHANAEQKVRGVIVSREITDDLRLACSGLQHVSLFEYQLSVTLKSVKAAQ